MTCCAGDTPAQVKMSNNKGHTGYLPCRYCNITGGYINGAVLLTGYQEPTEYGMLAVTKDTCNAYVPIRLHTTYETRVFSAQHMHMVA